MRSLNLNWTRTWISAVVLMMFSPLWVVAQDVAVHDAGAAHSGIYFTGGAGLALISEIGKAKIGSWYEKDGKAFYYDNSRTKKDGTPTLAEGDIDAVFDMGWALAGAIGYRFGALRAEGAGSYSSGDLNSFGGTKIGKDDYDTPPSFTTFAVMANGWYDFDTGTMFTPFVGLGLGAFRGTNSGGVPKNAPDSYEAPAQSAWGFAYQGGAGVAMEVVDSLSIRLGYQLFGTLETAYMDEETDSDALSFLPDSPDKAISVTAFPLLVHRIELGLSYQL